MAAKGHRKASPKEVTEALKRCRGLLYVTASLLKITQNTLRTYIKEYELEETVRECKGLRLDIAESQLSKAVDSGEPWAVCFTLKTLGKERGYVERQEMLHGNDPNNPFETSEPIPLTSIPLSLEVRQQIRDALRKQIEEKKAQQAEKTPVVVPPPSNN